MEGGVALFLLLILVVLAAGFGLALYMTGGALLARGDKEGKEGSEDRPVHKRPTSPTQEKVEMVGTRQDEDPDA
jgi:hypothetical protein